jgi:hypothetical protein
MAEIFVKDMYVFAKGVTFNRDANGLHYRPTLALQRYLSGPSSPILISPDEYRIVFGKKMFSITDVSDMAGAGINHGDTFDIVFQIDPVSYYSNTSDGVFEAAKRDLWYLAHWFEMSLDEAKKIDVEIAKDDEMNLDGLNSALQAWGLAPVPQPRTFNP